MMGTVIRTKKELQNLSQPVSYIAITYSPSITTPGVRSDHLNKT